MYPPGKGPLAGCVAVVKSTNTGVDALLASPNLRKALTSCAVVVLGPASGLLLGRCSPPGILDGASQQAILKEPTIGRFTVLYLDFHHIFVPC